MSLIYKTTQFLFYFFKLTTPKNKCPKSTERQYSWFISTNCPPLQTNVPNLPKDTSFVLVITMLPPFSILHFVQTFHSIMVVSFLFYETLNRQTAGGNRSENHPPSCDLCAANQHFSSVDFFRAHLQLASCNVSVKFKLSLCIFIDILNISQACFPGIFIAVWFDVLPADDDFRYD